jgi:sortase A
MTQPEGNYGFLPGLHSHNRDRMLLRRRERKPILFLRNLFVLAGIACCVFFAYQTGREKVYEDFENWVFDQAIAGGTNVTFVDYLDAKWHFGSHAAAPVPRINAPPIDAGRSAPAHLAEGDLLGRITIPRLNLAAVIKEGVDAKTLAVAVGHVPATSLPGNDGNFAVAAHRDSLFRALKNIKIGDIVRVQDAKAIYSYEIVATKIVSPSDVSVLRADGGGLLLHKIAAGQPKALLTMITCYPFYYVGSAPERFIAEGALTGAEAAGSTIR